MHETHWRVRMSGTRAALRQFLSKHPNEPLAVWLDGERVIIELLMPDGLVAEAAKFGAVKRLYDATEVGRARQSQVGRGNRFKAGDVPVGLGLKR